MSKGNKDSALDSVMQRMLRKNARSGSAIDALMEAMIEEFGTVYFLQAGPFIKIGFTRWPVQRRIAQLSTGCPYQIILLAEVRGSPDFEALCHRKFSEHRAHGEWFHATTEILNFIFSINQNRTEVAA